MVPTSFEKSNCILSPPEGVSLNDMGVLSAYTGKLPNGVPVIISCWKMTPKELKALETNGRIWLTVIGTETPPVLISPLSPFKKEEA